MAASAGALWADALRFLVAGVLIVSAVTKARSLVQIRQPILAGPVDDLSPGIASRLTTDTRVQVFAVAVELAIAAAALTAPRVGLWAGALLFLAFAVVNAAIPTGEPCKCFGDQFELEHSTRLRTARTLALAAAAVVGATLSMYAAPTEPFSGFVLAGALLYLSWSWFAYLSLGERLRALQDALQEAGTSAGADLTTEMSQ